MYFFLITTFSGRMRTQLFDGLRVVANYAKIISKSTKSISMIPIQKKDIGVSFGARLLNVE